MGLDPNDLRLNIEANVSAPGAQETTEQLKTAGQAADETRRSFDRLGSAAPPSPAQDAGQISAAVQAQQGLARSVSDSALATARAAGANEDYLLGVRRVADALLAQNRSETELSALRRAASGLGTAPKDLARLFPEAPSAAAVAPVRSVREDDVRGIARPPRPPRPPSPPGGGGTGDDGGAERTRRAAEGLDEPLTRARRGASDLNSIFNLSSQSLTRASLALVGVGAGLNALVTVANRLHQEIAAAVDAEVELAQRSREVTADYGPTTGAQVQARASAFTANSQTRGTEQDYLAAAAALHSLSSEYQLNAQQVDQLITASGQLARIHNTELAPAVSAVEGVLRGNLNAAQQYGVALTDEQGRIRGIGSTYQQLVDTVGRVRAEQILLNQVLSQAGTQQANAAAPADSTANALDRLRKASEQARQELTKLAEKPFNVAVNFLANIVGGFPGASPAAPPTGNLPVRPNAPAPLLPPNQQPRFGGGTPGDLLADAGLIGPQWRTSPQDRQVVGQPAGRPTPPAGLDFSGVTGAVPPIDPAIRAQMGLADATKTATVALDNQRTVFERISTELSGNLQPALARLASSQTVISGLGTIGQALAGPDAALTGGDIGRQASVRAAQDVFSLQRQRDAQTNDALVQQARDVNPAEFDRRQTAYAALNQATLAQTFAGRAQAQAQAGVSAIDLVDQRRQLDAAGDLARLRTETLGREGDVLDLQRQEADLADRMRVSQRENLDLVKQEAEARRAALAPAERLNDLQFTDRRAQLEAQAIRADVRRGALDPSALEQIPDLRQQIRQSRLAEPRAELQALDAQRPVDLVQRQTQRDQLDRSLRAIPLQQQQRGLEDQLTPLQQEQRRTDERTQGLNRQLELARLAEEPQRTAAERNVLAATAVSLAADQSVRSAQEWAAGIHDGLTDLERAWNLTQGITPAPGAGGVTPNPTPDRQADLGASSGGVAPLGDTVTNSVSITIHVPPSSSDPNAIATLAARTVVDALNRRATRAPSASPRTLAGAR